MHVMDKGHTSLCTNSTQPNTLSKTSEPLKKDTNEPNKTVITLTPATQKLSVSQPSTHFGACLLKTAIATISSSDTSLEGNILFDDGAQRSFISQQMAAKLNLQPNNKESISLASFGSNSAAHRNLPVGVIQVHTITGDKIPISVLIVPKLHHPYKIFHANHFNKYHT